MVTKREGWWKAELRGALGRRWVACLLALASGATPAVARAQADGPSAEDDSAPQGDPADAEDDVDLLQKAREAFLEGRRLMNEQAWSEAAAAFEEALAARPTPGLHFYLGVCLAQQGEFLRARQAYLDAQELLPQQPAADVAKLLPAAIQRAESHLSPLEIVLSPEGATLRLDGTTWTASRPPWLMPGPHVFYVEAPGYEPEYFHVVAKAGVVTRVEVTLELQGPYPDPIAAADPVPYPPMPSFLPPIVEPQPHSPLPRAAFWGSVTFGVLGAAAGAAGIVWHLDASARVDAKHAELDDAGETGASACYDPGASVAQTCDELRAAVAAEENAGFLIIGGFAAAGVGVLGAVVSWAIWPDEKFAVAPRLGLGSAGVELRGRF